MLCLLITGVFWNAAHRSPERSGDLGPVPTRAEAGTQAPVIGTGPLQRVLRVDTTPSSASAAGGALGLDPFTGATLATLSREDRAQIGTAGYVIQRYGYGPGINRTISLTFDDGPEPQVTPRLLDVLAREHVPATFFVVGRNVVQDPDLVQRMIREGHTVGGHTMTHPDLAHEPSWREHAELVATDRVLRHVTGRSASLYRLPYTSPETAVAQESIEPLLQAQRLGFVHASYDFDTLDWLHDSDPTGTAADIPLPDLSTGANVTMLLHDAGGPNRLRTVQYVERLVTYARAHGYTFTTMPQASPAIAGANAPAPTGWADDATALLARVAYDLPKHVMSILFAVAVTLMLALGTLNALLAVRRYRRRRGWAWPHPSQLRVPTSVVLAAYNEETVIARTLRSVLASDYPLLEIVVVDDGSSDLTAAAVEQVAASDPRVRLIQRPNGGKASALNLGVAASTGEVVVTLDADTIVTPSTITNLVRHFAFDTPQTPDSRRASLGAVAGVVRVGNRRRNLLTRWQALEYVTQIGLDRAAQDELGAISIIPGACAAWRRDAILGAGGYSSATLAEDCDLALTLHRQGWRVTQDDEAIAYTEAPETVDALLKQRERWTYGTLQAVYKNRRMMFAGRYKALGWLVLPNYVLSILIPLVFLPFVLVMAALTLQTEGPAPLLTYFGFFLLLQLGLAAVSIALLRERWAHLLMVPLYRLVFEPLRAYLLYTCVLRALQGGGQGWNKLDRSGTLDDIGDDERSAVTLAMSTMTTMTAVAIEAVERVTSGAAASGAADGNADGVAAPALDPTLTRYSSEKALS
ncbi:MAG: glycosyltransferase [Micrococcales bacterium]|nr:glycosyltransferase [Micrococcales bacterium]